MSIVLPDVCLTPAPPGPPVPIPYPNIGMSSDASQGPNTVSVEGQTAMVRGAKYSMTTGDEAGSVGGVMSGVIKGEAEFMLYSFDVEFEGKGVCRLGDPLFQNKKNIMG